MRRSLFVLFPLSLLLLAAPLFALERAAVPIGDRDFDESWAAGTTCTVSYYNTCTGWLWTWSGWSATDVIGQVFDPCCSENAMLAATTVYAWTGARSDYGFTGTISISNAGCERVPGGAHRLTAVPAGLRCERPALERAGVRPGRADDRSSERQGPSPSRPSGPPTTRPPGPPDPRRADSAIRRRGPRTRSTTATPRPRSAPDRRCGRGTVTADADVAALGRLLRLHGRRGRGDLGRSEEPVPIAARGREAVPAGSASPGPPSILRSRVRSRRSPSPGPEIGGSPFLFKIPNVLQILLDPVGSCSQESQSGAIQARLRCAPAGIRISKELQDKALREVSRTCRLTGFSRAC